jgi:hypothetical protein
MKEVKNTLIERIQEKVKMKHDNQEWYRDELRKLLSTIEGVTTKIEEDCLFTFNVYYKDTFVLSVSFKTLSPVIRFDDSDNNPLEGRRVYWINQSTKIGRLLGLNRIKKALERVIYPLLYAIIEDEDYESRKQALNKTNEQPDGTPVQQE